MYVLAHRGYSGKAPENTMAAFEMALETGSDGLEIDIHLSKDGEVVVIHDATVDRTTNGSGQVAEYTFAELQSFDAGLWFDEKFKGEQIPNFNAVCELVKGTNKLLNVELKAGANFVPLVENMVKILEQHGLSESIIVSSYNHYALVHCKQVAPHLKTAILYTAALINPWEYASKVGATALHPHHRTIVPQLVAEAQDNGMMVNPYTINEPADIERMIAAKVDSIITNEPERVKGML